MNAPPPRLLNGHSPPNLRTLAQWLGGEPHRRWDELVRFLQTHYPAVFHQRWVWGGAREGWRLRFFRRQPFCCLVPERGRFLVSIPLNLEEHARAEDVFPTLSEQGRADFRAAPVRAEGRCVVLRVTADEALLDVQRILALKRCPRYTPE